MRALLVIGVARDVQSTSLIDGLGWSCVYVPFQQQYVPTVTIAARTTGRQGWLKRMTGGGLGERVLHAAPVPVLLVRAA